MRPQLIAPYLLMSLSMSKASVTSSTATIENKLNERLELWNKLSSSIAEAKASKEKLGNSQEKAETVDEGVTTKKSELSKQIIQENKSLKELKKDIAELISGTDIYKYLGKINNISVDLATEINTIIVNNLKLKKDLESALVKEIADLYGLKQENIVIEPKELGKQDGFIITDKASGLKLFTKASKIFSDDTKSIDPRELFAYKVLENMDLGPETRFIITAGSSNPSGAKICHIVTKDAAYSDSDVQKVFFTDNYVTTGGKFNELSKSEKYLCKPLKPSASVLKIIYS